MPSWQRSSNNGIGCQRRLHDRPREVGRWLHKVLQGFYDYHAVPGNLRRLWSMRYRLLHRAGVFSAAAVSSGCRGPATLHVFGHGCPNRKCSIRILTRAFAPPTQGRSRMRNLHVRTCAVGDGLTVVPTDSYPCERTRTHWTALNASRTPGRSHRASRCPGQGLETFAHAAFNRKSRFARRAISRIAIDP